MEVTYFESGGRDNTESLMKIAKEYADKNKIKSIVVASTTGFAAEKASEIFKDKNLVIVTHVASFAEKDKQQFPEDLRKKLESKGIKVLTTTHGLGGVNSLDEHSIGSIVAKTLRMLSQGVKVAVEVTIMAADAGLIKTSEEIIAIGGTGKGSDTALVIRPENSKNLFDLKILKIIAKPL